MISAYSPPYSVRAAPYSVRVSHPPRLPSEGWAGCTPAPHLFRGIGSSGKNNSPRFGQLIRDLHSRSRKAKIYFRRAVSFLEISRIDFGGRTNFRGVDNARNRFKITSIRRQICKLRRQWPLGRLDILVPGTANSALRANKPNSPVAFPRDLSNPMPCRVRATGSSLTTPMEQT